MAEPGQLPLSCSLLHNGLCSQGLRASKTGSHLGFAAQCRAILVNRSCLLASGSSLRKWARWAWQENTRNTFSDLFHDFPVIRKAPLLSTNPTRLVLVPIAKKRLREVT